MKQVKKRWLLLLLALAAVAGCKRDSVHQTTNDNEGGTTVAFAVSQLFQDNMIIQRDKPAALWGTAPASAKVVVSASWAVSPVTAVADDNGNWKAFIPAAAASNRAQTITISAKGYPAVIISNVLLGDVWICSGQSNMVMPMDTMAPSFGGVLNYQQEIASANYPQIRIFTVKEDNEFQPISSLTSPANWEVCSPTTAGQVSAVAYYFARRLTTTLGVPIGIIVSAVNGSYCQDWANTGAIAGNTVLSQNYLSLSSGYYNGMINPLTSMSIKGFTWYQGENNQHDEPPSNYTLLNTALINGWRDKFNQGALPFYYVQLTPFAEDYAKTNPPRGDTTSDYLALFREAQANIRTTATGTGMAVTMDVGEPDSHHPRNKKPVGDRLALLALKHTYGLNVQCTGPQYASFAASGNTVTINFVSGTANGLCTANNQPLKQYFFVAGADHVFRWAKATISGSSIVITVPDDMPLPVQAVRYAFTNAPVTNLQNSAGLPAEPFRADNWDE